MALDGIVYPNEAWNVRGVLGLPSASTAGQILPTARGAAGRLFAFGFDAWKISAYLDKMANEGGLPGATGTLFLDSNGNVLRVPAWSTFSGGRPMPIASANQAPCQPRGHSGARRWKLPRRLTCAMPGCSRSAPTSAIAAATWRAMPVARAR